MLKNIQITLIPGLLAAGCLFSNSSTHAASLLELFESPPAEARSTAYWSWIDGNVTREGITADLESKHAVGMSGVWQFTLGMGIAPGPVDCLSDEYFAMVEHTLREAARLGMEVGFHNCPGFSSSGGPWVTPEDAMKKLSWTEVHVEGGNAVEVKLPQPTPGRSFYRDIAVLAVPESRAQSDLIITHSPILRSGGNTLPLAPLIDGEWRQGQNWADRTAVLEFSEPVRAASLGMAVPRFVRESKVKVAVSDDGQNFRELGEITIAGEAGTALTTSGAGNFELGEGRFWRISVVEQAGLPTPFPVSWLSLRGQPIVPDFDAYTAVRDTNKGMPDLNAEPAFNSQSFPSLDSVINITAQMAADGTLRWQAPAGEWTILRIGYSEQDRTNRPASASGLGLEVDKFCVDAVARHFNAYAKRWVDIAADIPDLKPLYVTVDSYEVGSQNWSHPVPATFERDHAYDITPWLVTYTGRVLNDPDSTRRFYWDLRYTLARMFAHNYYGELRRLANANGMKLTAQPAGKGNFSRFENSYQMDEPHFEFWTRPNADKNPSGRPVAFVARTLGRTTRVGAEAFTSQPHDDAWQLDPGRLKRFGDLALAGGANRMVYHASAHQPYEDVLMTYGRWGVNFNRSNTWWPLSAAFHEYHARAGALLQVGRTPADVLILQDEAVPNPFAIDIGPLANHEFDQAGPSLLYAARAENGELVLESGARYPLLALGPDALEVTPHLAEKIAELVEAGVPLRAQPFTGTPGLAGGDEAIARVRAAAKRIWEAGHPHVFTDTAPRTILQRMGVRPVFEITDPQRPRAFAMCRLLEANSEALFFVVSAEDSAVAFTASFGFQAPVVELWNPVNNERSRAHARPAANGRTEVDLSMQARDSVFVMFLQEPTTHRVAPTEPRTKILELAGPWTVHFPEGLGAPESITLNELTDWTESEDAGVRHFSGIARYETTFEWDGSGHGLMLEFEDVNVIAEVELNGTLIGSLWHPPYRVALGDAVQNGTNRLVVRVANNWVNRMIGDARLPDDAEYRRDPFHGDRGENLVRWPDWFENGGQRPTDRITLSTYRYWRAEDPLQPSGIVGSVVLTK